MLAALHEKSLDLRQGLREHSIPFLCPIRRHLAGLQPFVNASPCSFEHGAAFGEEVGDGTVERKASLFGEALYRGADIFVLPSVSEGMSNALLEAMSYGLLVLASDIPENRSVIQHGKDGLLFRQGDSEDLARKLESLVANVDGSAQRLARAARDTAQRRFSVGAVVDRLEAIYGELVDSRA